MKILKLFQIIMILISPLLCTEFDVAEEDTECKNNLVRTYGLVGNKLVQNYNEMKEYLSNDYCPSLKYSCCTKDDFENSNKMWQKVKEKVKFFTTKVYRMIVKMTTIKTTLLQTEHLIKNKNVSVCKNLNFDVFNKNINNQDVFFYLQNSLDSFVFLQKGFYCLICDSKYHKYLEFDNIGFSKRITISENFCNDIIFYFREFLIFKKNYIDPVLFETDKLNGCVNDEENYKPNYLYEMYASNITDCVEDGKNCQFLCNTFVFGSSGSLLIGGIENYEKFFYQTHNISSKLGLEKDLDEEDQGKIQNYLNTLKTADDKFFETVKDSIYDLSNLEIIIQPEGINMFLVSKNSNYLINDDVKNINYNLKAKLQENIENFIPKPTVLDDLKKTEEENHEEEGLTKKINEENLDIDKKIETTENKIENKVEIDEVKENTENLKEEIVKSENLEEDNMVDQQEIKDLDNQLDDFRKEEEEVLHNKAFTHTVEIDEKVEKDKGLLNGSSFTDKLGLNDTKGNVLTFFVYFSLLIIY